MEGESATIDSSSDVTAMDQNTPSSPGDNLHCQQSNNDDGGAQHVISSCGADDESETDELTIDDSCVNNEDMMDDDNNVAIVSSSTLHQMNDDEEEEQDEQEDDDGPASSGNNMNSEPEAAEVMSQPLRDEEDADELMKNDSNENDAKAPQQPAVSTSSKVIIRNSNLPSQVKTTAQRSLSKDAEDDDVDIDGIDETVPTTVSATTPSSPPTQTPESPVQSQSEAAVTLGSPDASSQHEQVNADTAKSPSPPQSPIDEASANGMKVDETPSQSSVDGGHESSQTEAIISQDNFSQFNSSQQSLHNTTMSQISADTVQSSSQDETPLDRNEEPEPMDTSHVESSQDGTQSPPPQASENDESQQSTTAPSKSASEECVPKSRSKSRSRSNTDDGEGDVDDADLEDGEIMDDEEEEPKAISTSSSKEKKEKERDRSTKSSSSRSSDKERSSRDKDKEREKEKDKHRKEKEKDKKRSKRDEEKEKEKESKSSSKTSSKKRKASDAGESEQDDYLLGRGGTSPSSGAPPLMSADPWSAAVEEFGDDSKVSRAKRRRESDGETSPHHHHHPSRPVREATPPSGPGRRQDNRNNKRPVREERKEPKSDVICAYYMQGKCQKSAIDCTFSHDAVPPRKMELCKFWMMECCAKKEKCLYLHNDFPCKFFHTGLICKQGDRCKFSHSALSEVTKQVLLKHIETAPKEILGDFPRLNRQGALNLINKMEARMRGENVDDDKDTNIFEMNQNDHHNNRGQMGPGHHDRHGHNHSHGHGRNDDRHGHGRPGRDHANHGHGHHPHMNQRGNNDMRGGPPGRGDDRHNNNNNNRSSRWEQQQPSRGDQEKLHELMQEAGISGFYKETLDTGIPPPGAQHQGPPGPFPQMQPPLLPINPVLMQQMLPGLLPQPNSVNNPALANVLASLNIPSTSIAPPTTLSAGLPPLSVAGHSSANVPTSVATSQASDESSSRSPDGKHIPEHLPKMQQELFLRIQKQQQKNEKKMQNFEKSEPEEPQENWYSSEDEDDPKKKENAVKSEISNKISSVLNQIRQQNQPKSSSSPVLPSSMPLPPLSESSSTPSFYRDTDFRNQPSSFKDVDLRNPSSIFKKIDIEPAKEINASVAHNGPVPYRVRKVAGIPKIDYSSIKLGMPPSTAILDPRLVNCKRSNSIPAPASPTGPSSPDIGIPPLTIPDGTPVFDPRTARGGGGSGPGSSAGGRNAGPPGMTPQQNNPFLDSDNRFVSLPNPGGVGMNDFNPFFNRDPRGGNPGNNQGGPGGQNPNIAAMAAAMAAMQQQLPPNMQAAGGIDPLMMLGFPFLPQQQPGGVDFQQMLAAGGPGALRMRPPFNNQQQPPSSSWERLNQGQQGQGRGDLTPPL